MVSKLKQSIRVRIAPSPTGYLHIGTARTALFNWLLARKEGGSFVLRVEDTDLERSDSKYERDVMENLEWLGLVWDEGPLAALENKIGELPFSSQSPKYKGDFGPYRQSERLDVYEKYLKKLLDENLAYYCYCSKEELETERQSMLAQGLPPKYSGKCRAKPKSGENPQLIRFKVSEAKLSFTDLIRGKITFDTSLIGDIAIAKDLKSPLYNFAVVIDDYEMKILHVIRGEDHIANTPKQILLQKALGFPLPQYAHLPLILDSDRSKMSKRYLTTSIKDYRDQGYLPEALVNFMALLGWHPAPEKIATAEEGSKLAEKEIFSIEELVKSFDLRRVQKSGAVFNLEKLNWINAQHIKSLSNEELLARLAAFDERLLAVDKNMALKIVGLIKERMKKLSEFGELAGFFLELPDYPKELLIWKDTPATVIKNNLEQLLELASDPAKILNFAEEKGRGDVLWPLRAALSGKEASPGPLEILEVLGTEESIRRIKVAVNKL